MNPARRRFLSKTLRTGQAVGAASLLQKFSLFLGLSLHSQKVLAQFAPMQLWRRRNTALFTLWGWGIGTYGSLGDGTSVSKSAPVQIGSYDTWSSISAGSLHTVGVKADGTLWVWGDNTNGNLGTGNRTVRSSPVQIGAGGWASASAGGAYTAAEHYFTMAIKTDGTLWAWGDNSRGQLGDGTVVHRSSPVQIGGDTDWAYVTAGWGLQTLAIKSNGTLWAWGNAVNGRLGDGTIVNKSSPVQIGALNTWVKVAGGESHSIALKADHTLWIWGGNADGQLGDSTTSAKSSPVQIGAAEWSHISAGPTHNLALKTDGSLWAWGSGSDGILGQGNVTDKSAPVQIGAQTWTEIDAGYSHNLGIQFDGSLWAWGESAQGQLGDGGLLSRSAPVQIGTDTTWTKVSAGESFSFAIKK